MLGSLLLAAALGAAPSAPSALDAKSQALISRPTYERIVISPDGKLLAVAQHDQKGTSVLILKSSDQTLVQTIDTGIKAEISDLQWLGSNHLIVGLNRILSAYVVVSHEPSLYLFSLDGSRPRTFPSYFVSTIDGDETHVLVAYCKNRAPELPCITEAARLDINDLKEASKSIAEAPVGYAKLMSDHAGAIRFAWATDENGKHRLYVTDNGKDWTLLNDEDVSGVDIRPQGISRDGKSAFLVVQHKDGPDSVERYDFATGTRTVLLQDATSDPLNFLESLDTHDLVGAMYGPGRPQARFWNPSSQDALLRMAIVKAFPDSTTSISSTSADGSLLIVKTESDRDPGTFYLLDMVHHKAQFLVRNNPSIDPKQQLASEPFTMKARDGLILNGFVTKPAGSNGPSPMVVVVHGGPIYDRDDWGFDSEVQLMAQHGYAVLRVNYRGTDGEGLAFREKGTMQWGAAIQDDIADATRWAITQGIADPKRICIYGGSFGAYAALMGVVREPGLYRCAAGFGGVYDLSKLYTWGDLRRNYYSSQLWLHYLQHVIGQDDKQLADRSPITHAAEIKIPVFLAHGHMDGRVDVRQSEYMRDALEKAGNSPQYVDYPLEVNGIADPADRIDFYTRLINFFDANLGPSTVSTSQATVGSNQQAAAH